MARGRTMVYDKANRKTYVGNFERGAYHTAHQELCRAAGVNYGDAIGGSIKPDGHIEYRSRSLNDGYRSGMAHGNCFRPAKRDLSRGDYYTVSKNTVSKYGSVNRGQKHYDFK